MDHISRLAMNDIDDILSKRGNSSVLSAPLSDRELALSFFAEEAEGLLIMSRDYALSGGVDGRNLAVELLNIEETAHYDHLIAIALSEDKEPPSRPLPHDRTRLGRNDANRYGNVLLPQYAPLSNLRFCKDVALAVECIVNGRCDVSSRFRSLQ